MRRSLAAAVVVVSVAVLAGCGGGSSSGAPSTSTGKSTAPAAGGPGKYQLKTEGGATITIDIPAPTSSVLLRTVEGFRAQVKKPPLTYALVTIDNSRGKEEESVAGFTVVTTTGKQYVFDHAFVVVGKWQEGLDPSSALYDRGTTVYNGLLNLASALPAATTADLMTSHKTGFTVKSVYINSDQLKKV